jgi:hypothetical protein
MMANNDRTRPRRNFNKRKVELESLLVVGVIMKDSLCGRGSIRLRQGLRHRWLGWPYIGIRNSAEILSTSAIRDAIAGWESIAADKEIV